MVTKIIKSGTLYHEDGSIDKRVEVYGLSSDVKPINVPNSVVFYEMDTQKVYMFDKQNSAWLEQ